LEKKKDYKLRSKVFHKNENILNSLRLKSSLKNEDEFYHKMINAKVKVFAYFNAKKGDHVESDSEESLNNEQKSIINTQNKGLVLI